MNVDIRICGLAIVAMALTACGQEKSAAEITEAAPEEHSAAAPEPDSGDAGAMSVIGAALSSSARPDGDAADDKNRKPADVLAFSGVAPGMTIFELEAGAGYYTELLSSLVGSEGKIIMQNPESFDSFLGDAVVNRLANDRLANVRLSKTSFDMLDAADASADIATWFLGPHELYFTPSDGVSLGEVDRSYAEIFRVLKPGGAFVVLDHAALPGSPETSGGTLHRIDPAIIKDLAANAGFVIVDESDVLRNPDDDFTMGVFDPAVRRKTDRFLIKFKKPE